jgi:hypothetical protein
MLMVIVPGCSSSSDMPPVNRSMVELVGQVPTAVSAVQGKVGGGAQFSEINVNPEGVNLFVIADGAEKLFTFANGALAEQPDAPDQAPSVPPGFAAGDVSLGKGPDLVAQVEKTLPGSRVVTVAIVTISPEGLVWAIRSQSAKGGYVNSLFDPQGKFLAAAPA